MNADGDVGAVDVTATGDIKGKTLANTNGSFSVDKDGNVSAVDITSVGDVKANTFANNTETFAVDIDGNVTAGNVTTTGNVQAYNINADNNLTAGKAVVNGVVQGGSFANTNESFKVDGAGNVTANSVTELTNTTLDVDNFAKVGRAATEEQLSIVNETAKAANTEAGKHTTVVKGSNIDITEGTNAAGGKEYTISAIGLANTDLSNITTTGENKITNLAKGSDQHIKAQEYIVSDDGTVTMTYVDGNGQAVVGEAKITGLATSAAVTAAKTEVVAGKNVTVTPDATAEDGHTKYTVNANDTKITGDSNISVTGGELDGNNVRNYSVKLADIVNIGSGDKKVTIDGTTGEISGLTNKDWNTDETSQKSYATSTKAATEAQLKHVYDAIDEAQGTTYTKGDGINISQDNKISVQAADGGNVEVTSAGVDLKDDINLASVTASNAINVGSAGTQVKIDGATGKITGLSNTTWDKDIAKAVEDNVNGEAGYAATQGQLKTVYDEAIKNATGTTYTAGDGLNLGTDNKFSVKAGQGVTVDSSGVAVKAGDGISVSDAGVAVSLSADSNLELKGTEGQKTLGLKDDISLTKVTTTDGFYVDGGGNFTKAGLTIGKTKLTSTGLTTASVSGLTNTKWEEGTDYSTSDKAATEAQLYKAINDVDGKTYTAGDGITIGTGENPEIAVNANKEKGIEVTTDGVEVKLATTNSNLDFDTDGGLKLADNLTGLTSVTANEFKVGSETYISSAGINANSKKITNVDNGDIGKDSKDAINGGQLYSKINEVKGSIKTYEAGDGISISGNNNTISVNADKTKGITVSDAGVAVNAGDGLTFDTTAGKVGQLKVATGNGITVDDGSVAIDLAENSNLTVDNGLSLAKDLTGLTSIGTGTLTASGDVLAENFVTTSGSVTAGGITINDANGRITGLTDGLADTDAVTVKQLKDVTEITDLAVTYRSKDKQAVDLEYNKGNGTTITNVAAGDISKATSMDAVNGGQLYATNQIVGDGEYTSHNFLSDDMNLTRAASVLDDAIGDIKSFDGNKILKTSYNDIASALDDLDAGIGTLNFTGDDVLQGKQDSVTIALSTLNNAVGSLDFTTGMTFIGTGADLTTAARTLDISLSSMANAIGFRKNAEGGTSLEINWDGFHYSGTTVVDTLRHLDTQVYELNGRVTTLETSSNAISDFSASNISTLNALSNMDMNTANTLASISPNALKAVANLSAENTVISDSEPATDSTTNSVPSREPENGNTGITTTKDAVTVDRNVTVNGDTTLNGDLNVRDNVSVGGTFEVDGKATFNNDVSIDGTLNMNNNVITGVKDGKVSADSSDAINGSQLYAVEQKVDNNSQAINAVGNQVNRLSNRIDKVGAGAAALAALHPLDFDPDDKLSFAAGYGNYAGENAVAVGAFYQPNEDTMFSVGGTFGNDENMVNAGVSFKLGQKSNVSRSRVSMAKELVSLRDEVAQLKALMAHAGILPSNGQFDTSALFPDVPENHWAYEYVHELGRLGILEGYADGNFEGDRMMTRYEMAAIVYRAMQKGVNIDSRMLKEFEPELKLIRVDVVARDDDGNPTIERVRVNEDTQQV